jgi:hypothetical protein
MTLNKCAACMAIFGATLFSVGAVQAQYCSAVQSAATVATVVELYTSEGCDSCPPTDRWLSEARRARPDLIAAAFHVDYWDRLGWKDRFASPAYTARQAQAIASSGARFAYTPQLIVNGHDWRGRALPAASTARATVSLLLQRGAGDQVSVDLHRLAGAPAQVQLWWAAVEDGHQSDVKAGENRGVVLKHDAVVRDYARVAATGSDQQLMLTLPAMGEGGRKRTLVVVATDAATGRVLQAAQLGC